MKILEIIELRTAPGNTTTVENYLRDWLRESDKDAQVIKSYRHMNLNTDFSVHISYEINSGQVMPYTYGKQLAESLKEFGLVNHSVWNEQKCNE